MSNSEAVQQLINEGKLLDPVTREMFEKRDRDGFEKSVHDAIALFKQALELEPDNSEAHYWLGNKYFELQDFAASLEHYDKVLNLLRKADPVPELFLEARVNRTGALCELERYDDAISECDRIMKDYQSHADSKDINASCSWIKNTCQERKEMMGEDE